MLRPACVLALVLAASAPAAHAHDPAPAARSEGVVAPEAEAAADVVDRFHAALRAGDTDGALALLAEDVLILEQGGAERSRDEYAAHHLGADAAFAAAVPEIRLRRAGWAEGDIAWIATEGRTTGTYEGRAVDRLTVETMVLQRGPEGWRIRHVHWSSRAAQ